MKLVGAPGGYPYYYFCNALDSLRVVWQSGKTGATFSVKTYKPFETPVAASGSDQKWKYAGEMLAGAAGSSPGLHYIFARRKDPQLGRFIPLDPKLERLRFLGILNEWLCPGSV